MKNKKLTIKFLFILLISFLLSAEKTLAVCPVCTIAVGAGVGFSRWLGINDIIIGLWIGGLIVSMIFWTISWLAKKNKKGILLNIFITLAYYILTIWPLYTMKIIGNPVNTLCYCGLDKLLLGIFVGSCSFWFGANLYDYLKEKNNGHAHFPFEKVVLPIAPLIILSIIFYFITK